MPDEALKVAKVVQNGCPGVGGIAPGWVRKGSNADTRSRCHPRVDPSGMQNDHLHNGAPVRVLVVDDSRTSADAPSAYHQAGGMDVLAVFNHRADALTKAKAWIPDRIVPDAAMPGLSGIGGVGALRPDRCQRGAQRTVPSADRFGVQGVAEFHRRAGHWYAP